MKNYFTDYYQIILTFKSTPLLLKEEKKKLIKQPTFFRQEKYILLYKIFY